MPRQPHTDAYRSMLVMLRLSMLSMERDILELTMYRFDDLSPSERAQLSDFCCRYCGMLQQLCELCRQQGI